MGGPLGGSGGPDSINITNPSAGGYCVSVAPSPGLSAPVIATAASPSELVEAIYNTDTDRCPGTYGVITLGLKGGVWTTTGLPFDVAVL